MYRFKLLFTLISTLSLLTAGAQVTNCLRSQKQADLWYFGDKAGIDFRSGTATAVTSQDVMLSFKSSAITCDSLGNLLFFTDAKLVWDKNNTEFEYAPSLEGDRGVTQPCLIVPKPDDSNLYYVFTIDKLSYPVDTMTAQTQGFRVSVVNMNLNNGLGNGTLQWNIPLLSQVCQKLTAVKNSNNKDYWVITHEWNSAKFYSYPVTENGIGTPVVSTIGSVHGTGYYGSLIMNNVGYMKASPDGKMIALAIPGNKIVELFDFNNSTGSITAPRSYTFTDPVICPYGIEFSSDNKKLYTSLLRLSGNGLTPPDRPSRVYQFDIPSGLVNPVLIDSVPGIRIGGLQLATDGRIYVARTISIGRFKDTIDVIYNPTRPGLECNYSRLNNNYAPFWLGGKKCIFGFPNFIQSYFNRPVFTHDSVCDGNVTMFSIVNDANIDSVLWNFGDGATSTSLEPVHQYTQTGTFKVALTEYFNGISYMDSLSIKIYKLPDISLGPDTLLLYDGASVNLRAGGGFRDYLWNTGSKDSLITVGSGGDYWARVQDFNCCYNYDTIYVNVFKYYLPNAFSPNGDGLNDLFRVRGLYQNIRCELLIYDRWGKLCYVSDDMDEGWNGEINGKPAPSGTYAWILHIDFPDQDIITNGNIVYKGTVTLIR